MELYEYSVNGSALSIDDRRKLIELLDSVSYTGITYVNMKNGLYRAMIEENIDISSIPFPSGTIIERLHQ